STGELGYQVKVQGKGELAETAQAFNEMSRKLQTFYNERKHAEQELQQNEARIRAVVDNVLDGIVTINERGVVESFNRSAERIFDYSSEEIIGRQFNTLLPKRDRSEYETYVKNYARVDKERMIGFGLEITGQRKNGSTFPMELGLSEMRLGDGRVFVGIVRDITDRKKIDQMKNEFISTVSHELRTPLTSMLGSLSLLSEGVGGELSEQGKILINMARNNTSRLVHLIGNILDTDNIQSGKMRLRLKPVELMPLVNQAVEESRAYAGQLGVKYVLAAALPDAKVHADRERLIQVINNLLSNAAKFSPSDSAVEVAVIRRGMTIRVSVSDHGPGIPKKFHDRIFQRFARIDSLDTRQQSGAGLGLSIAKAIVEKHGGHIDFETQVEGGTRFYFELPEWHDDQARAHA
ncbi:MAG TPA: ATP-binding protein, partial [Acidiferrobacterales bacterium]|nr:ATP-binding protein [Acidiferrobacterales bacterium]